MLIKAVKLGWLRRRFTLNWEGQRASKEETNFMLAV